MINNIIICGPSAVGKDTVARLLLKYLQSKGYNVNLVISNTTRPKRLNEIDNVDYHFCNTVEEFNNYKYLEQTEFRGWKYGVPAQNLQKKKHNILVLNPIGVQNLVLEKKKRYIIIYLYEHFFVRLIRSVRREKKIKIEMLRRGLTDTFDFWKFEKFCNNNHIEYFKLKNTNNECTVKNIEKILRIKIFSDNLK